MVSTPVVVTLYRALSRSLRRLQPQISRHGRSPATLFTEHEMERLGAISPVARQAIIRECKVGAVKDADGGLIARFERPSALVQTVQQLFRQPPPLQAELKGQASGEAAVVSLQARVSSLQAEKAAMQDTAQDLISALEASGSGHPDAAALREELAAMTARYEANKSKARYAAKHAREAPGYGDPLDGAFAALPLLNNRVARLERWACEPHSDAVTHGVRIRVESQLNTASSLPGRYTFEYFVHIVNAGAEPVQLVSRHWKISDNDGEETEVRGTGVVGKQPILGVGESFQYGSGAVLKDLKGSMRGSYQMLAIDSNRLFEAEVAPFALCPPLRVTEEVNGG